MCLSAAVARCPVARCLAPSEVSPLVHQMVLAADSVRGETSMTITHVVQGRPPTNVVVATVRGKGFEKIRKQVERIVRLMGDANVWNDYGPDASHVPS